LSFYWFTICYLFIIYLFIYIRIYSHPGQREDSDGEGFYPRSAKEQEEALTLEGLPYEVGLRVCNYLSPTDLLSLALASSHTHALAADHSYPPHFILIIYFSCIFLFCLVFAGTRSLARVFSFLRVVHHRHRLSVVCRMEIPFRPGPSNSPSFGQSRLVDQIHEFMTLV
jgi:hypothetical protein